MSSGGPNEADTCAAHVRPAIARSGWSDAQVHEQYAVQADLPVPVPGTGRKRFADYVLELEPGVPLVVIEAKRLWARPDDGLQQAIRYATLLAAPFALSTNGSGWVLHNLIDGVTSSPTDLPTPVEAWDLFTTAHGVTADAQALLLSRFSDHHRTPDGSVRQLRYYQTRAIHEILIAMYRGERRLLAVMATGTGKTFTAMQLVWKLWNFRKSQQKSDNARRNFRVLYLADRNVLVKDPLDKTFVQAFGRAAVRVNSKNTKHSPDIYFATYQALDTVVIDSEADTGEVHELVSNYPPDFFDLVIVDECHRGSAREESSWRSILDYFSPATQLGLTATPVDKGTAVTYEYFGNPVYEYSLREGIEDGFLAPYSIRRVQFDVDATGLEVAEGLIDTRGRELPAGNYSTRDFERTISLPDRTRAMAAVIDRVIGDSGDRAVVFCVDSEHALEMAMSLRNLRPERTAAQPEWVARIMSVEREKDRLLEQFTDPERSIPQVAVTTRLLSTGVDIQDLRYVVIARAISSVAEFKQIIGRGTRLYPDKGKYEFEIVDFVGATKSFSDPEFDGPPLRRPTVETVDGEGCIVDFPSGDANPGDDRPSTVEEPEPLFTSGTEAGGPNPTVDRAHREKFVLSGIPVEIDSEGFWVHDMDSGKPRLVSYVDWARERVLNEFTQPEELLSAWSSYESRSGILTSLRSARIDPDRLMSELGIQAGEPVDTVDQLVRLAWDRPVLTRSERARNARAAHSAELEALSATARAVLGLLLDTYAESGIDQVASSSVIRVRPISDLGQPGQIAREFGGAEGWRKAQLEVQRWLYSA